MANKYLLSGIKRTCLTYVASIRQAFEVRGVLTEEQE